MAVLLTGAARIDDVLDGYIAFYADRVERGLVVDRAGCPYTADTLRDRAFVRRNMPTNPFEKFERKRFLYYSKDLGQISMNHALLSRLSVEDFLEAVKHHRGHTHHMMRVSPMMMTMRSAASATT